MSSLNNVFAFLKFKFLRECKLNPPTNHERFHPKCQNYNWGLPRMKPPHEPQKQNGISKFHTIPSYILHTDNHHLAVLACAEVGWILSPRGAGIVILDIHFSKCDSRILSIKFSLAAAGICFASIAQQTNSTRRGLPLVTRVILNSWTLCCCCSHFLLNVYFIPL